MTIKLYQIGLFLNNVSKGIKQSYNKRLKPLIPLSASNVIETRRSHSHKVPFEHVPTSFLTKKYSIIEILQTAILAIVTSLLFYSVSSSNEQISLLNSQTLKTNESLDLLNKEISSLKTQIAKQKSKISNLEKQFNEQDLAQEFTGELMSSSVNPDLIVAKNEMTQFYIKTAGYVVCGLVVIAIVYSVTSTTSSWFSIKGMLPDSVYSFVQNNSPFFQERVYYTYFDKDSGTGWLIGIINNRKVDLKVKPNDGLDYIPLREWLSSLNIQRPSTTEASLQVAEAVTSAVPIDISSVPSGASIDVDLVMTSITPNQEVTSAAAAMAEHISKMF